MNMNLPELDLSPESVPLRRSVWLIFFSAVFVLLLILGRNPLLGSEGVTAESIRQMLAGKDIFALDQWNPDSFLSLWFSRLHMFPVLIFGNNEFAWRFFSFIPALFLLGGMMLLADDISGRRVMCCAGWLLTGSYGFIYWGRNASSFIILAAWCVWSAVVLTRRRNSLLNKTVFFFLFFSGCFWWGMHYILTVPGIMVITYLSWKNNFFTVKSIIPLIAGAVVAVLISFLFLWYPQVAWGEYPARFWQLFQCSFMESVRNTVYPEGAYFNNGKFLLNLPRLLFPWTLLAICVIWVMCRNFRELPDESRYLLYGTALILLLSCIFPARRLQYQLAQLPFFLIICSIGIAGKNGNSVVLDYVILAMKWGAAFMGSFAVAVFAVWPLWDMIFHSSMPMWIMLGIPALGLLSLGALVFDTGATSMVERVSGMQGRWSGCILSWVCLSAAFFSIGIPALGGYRTGKTFWKKCGETVRLKNPDELIFYRSMPGNIEYCYMNIDRQGEIAFDEDQLRDKLKKTSASGCLIVFRNNDYSSARKVWESAGWQMAGESPDVQEKGKLYLFREASPSEIRSGCFIRKKER